MEAAVAVGKLVPTSSSAQSAFLSDVSLPGGCRVCGGLGALPAPREQGSALGLWLRERRQPKPSACSAFVILFQPRAVSVSWLWACKERLDVLTPFPSRQLSLSTNLHLLVASAAPAMKPRAGGEVPSLRAVVSRGRARCSLSVCPRGAFCCS